MPLDSMEYPRYSSIATFFRLPNITDPGKLDIAVLGVPYDTSAGFLVGTRMGPRTIRERSQAIRITNAATGKSPFREKRIADAGDVSTNPFSIEQTYDRIEKHVDRYVSAGCKVLSVGGDHGITYPILKATAKKHGPLAVIHIDAHPDTHKEMFGQKMNHATMLYYGVEGGHVDPKKVWSIGIRGTLFYEDDLEYGRSKGFHVFSAEEFTAYGVPQFRNEVQKTLKDVPVYLTLDIDGIDPAYAPGTAVPEINGVLPREALGVIRSLDGLNVVGADICEVAPPFDCANNMTSLLAANFMFEMLCVM